ncbi:penicillin acylase family protein [Biformimicrobium ophioploci]|uniref:N-acylhomoserine lactone acylase HacB n=1 Tax=Biformimicrobium ophioploci TaxID=3036711 RepID=A0ABQ6LZW1_9GAMM|nr:penicillin acylase family protein [Microbulbifer sp. NKW57]GMG87582.1 N-acylhomoserine lactone acylase HacB [Microbulbifer sp. NKW57]
MKKLLAGILGTGLLVAALTVWTNHHYQTVRNGELTLQGLVAPVQVRYDHYGVPHINAENLNDLYRALGYVHAKDRLFQMDLMRRLASGRLAELFGPELVKTDTLFRTLGIRAHAEQYVHKLDMNTPAGQALTSYLAGINAFVAQETLPLEFDLLGVKPEPFTAVDTISVSGYLAYSFAMAMRSEPLMTRIAATLGKEYLADFDLQWQEGGVLEKLSPQTLASLGEVAALTEPGRGLPLFEGSNAWAIAGTRSASGFPILASDPHISFSVPGAWWEAHLNAPGFELYGHHQALVPTALLGHNSERGWGLTMFQNDDMDFYLEELNPENPTQVRVGDGWQEIISREEKIQVKGQDPVAVTIRATPRGPIINDVFDGFDGRQPVSLWWAFLQTENPMLDALYKMNHADSLEAFGKAVSGIHAPGLNVMYADAEGNIAWWAAAKVPNRPAHVQPWLILDGASGNDEPDGFHPFSSNPQEVNPERGYIVSANHQPQNAQPVPGYYNLPARARRIDQLIAGNSRPLDLGDNMAIQMDDGSDFALRALDRMIPVVENLARGNAQQEPLLQALQAWDGQFSLESIAATVFTEWQYQVARAAFHDELGESFFGLLVRTRSIDHGFYNLVENPESPWWNNSENPELGGFEGAIAAGWSNAIAVLQEKLGEDTNQWQWQAVHTFEQEHPMGKIALLDRFLNVGPVPVSGSHAVPNNLSQRFGSGHQAVKSGPSTRRLIDFGSAENSLGILPAGQSGNPFDAHFEDQLPLYVQGKYRTQLMDEKQITEKTSSTLLLTP